MHCKIVDDRLLIGGRPATFVPSPNIGGRIEPTQDDELMRLLKLYGTMP